MKKILTIVLLFASLLSCRQASTTNKDAENHSSTSSNGIYYWKTRFHLNDYELDFLKKREISRIYVKMFDVVLQNESPSDTLSVIPTATTRFESPIPENIDITLKVTSREFDPN